jgi:hypothetical protein
MKPVNKGTSPQTFSSHGLAKPFLISRIGGHCSYCEVAIDPQVCDVEHIYPQASHPEKETLWDNFGAAELLVGCCQVIIDC